MPYPIKIANLVSKGLGVIATQTLKPGQLILREHPLVRVDNTPVTPEARSNPRCAYLMGRVIDMARTNQFNPRSEFSTWPTEVVNCFVDILDEQANIAYGSLDTEKQKRWMELADVHAEDGDEKTPGGILRTNAIDDANNRANLYHQLSRMNHSCSPNATRVLSDSKGGVNVVANRNIGMGEEVLISYTDGDDDGLPAEERRRHLMQQYHFHCTCELCMEQEKNTN